MKNITRVQTEICHLINDIGGRIRFVKEYNIVAQFWYVISGREPAINVEALLLGERFGVIIGTPPAYRYVMRNSKYRIFHVKSLEDFRQQFQSFKREKLTQ